MLTALSILERFELRAVSTATSPLNRPRPMIRLRPRPLTASQLLEEFIAGRISPSNLSFHQEMVVRRLCRERARASVARIQSLCDKGHWKKARRERAAHLKSSTVHLDSLLHAARKRWPVKLSDTAAQREVIRVKRLTSAIDQLNNVGKLKRAARARQFPREKSNGGSRTITAFPMVDQARQRVLKSALTPFANLHEGQFMLSRDKCRRGPAAVREALLDALNTSGDDCVFIQFDVIDFYGSISQDWLERTIGLDHAITKSQLHLGGMALAQSSNMADVHDRHEATPEKSLRGIPQGSAVSSLISEQAMAAVLRSVAVFGDFPLFVWSDNLGMIVPRIKVDETVKLVRAAFADSEAGPFQLTVTRSSITTEFKFLGIWYRVEDDGPKAFIPENIISTWVASIVDRLMTSDEGQLNEIEKHINSKLASWRWYGGIIDAENYLRSIMISARAQFTDR